MFPMLNYLFLGLQSRCATPRNSWRQPPSAPVNRQGIETVEGIHSSSSGPLNQRASISLGKSPPDSPKVESDENVKKITALKEAFAKQQREEAAILAAAAILDQQSGPRIRLLPHQHTLFCERKVCVLKIATVLLFIPSFCSFFQFIIFQLLTAKGMHSSGTITRTGSCEGIV